MNYNDDNNNYNYRHIRYMRRPLIMSKQTHEVTCPPQLHFHDAHELMLITQGQYRLYAPQKIYEGEGPCIVLFKLGTYHGCVRLNCEVTPFMCYVANYHQSVIDGFPSHMFNGTEIYETDVRIIPIDDDTVRFLSPLFDKLWTLSKSYTSNDPVPPAMYGYFLSVLNYIWELAKDGNGVAFDTATDSEYYISKVIKIVLETIERGEDVSVSALAEQFFISRSKLSKDFHRTAGITLKQMIDELKLERIKKMLRNGLDNKEIAARCGFSNDSYFIQFFNKHMNMSPGTYRQLKAEKSNNSLD